MGTPPTIEVASLGMADSLILMVLALVVFGPRRLPQIGRQIGKLMYEFRKASNDFKFQMEEEMRNAEEADRRKKEEQQRALALAAPAQEATKYEPSASQGTDYKIDPPMTPAVANALPAANVVESPYPGEGQYPTVIDPPTEQSVEAAPRIQPPASGEPVSATPPFRQADLTEPAGASSAELKPNAIEQATEDSAPQADVAAEETTAKQTTPATEAIEQHG
jgi:sec-independent protein translocase protein TatB